MRQELKRNYDSISVEELDWSAESQVLIPSGVTLNADLEPKIHNQTPVDKSTGTPPSIEEKKALPNCGNKDGNLKIVFPPLLKQF